MNRRSFLASILASGFAPAAIGSGVLMPVRQLVLPADARFLLFKHPITALAGDVLRLTCNSDLHGESTASYSLHRAGVFRGAWVARGQILLPA